jgi:pimeloyl-ACP methyl ester carboxylesterase
MVRMPATLLVLETHDSQALLHHEAHRCPGSAEWLVLLHGAGGSLTTWKRQVAVLRGHLNVLAIDLPGHGGSATMARTPHVYTFDSVADMIWSVIDAVGIQKVHLAGVSLGTVIAMKMEQRRPQDVGSLINGGAILRLSKKIKFLAAISLRLAKVIGYPAFYRINARIMLPRKNHRLSRLVFIRESAVLTDVEFRKWTAMYSTLDRTLRQLFREQSTTPHLVVMGEEDHFFLGPAKEYAMAHPNVELQVFARCGHVVSIEKARQFNEACLAFLHRIGAIPAA